MAEPRSSDDLDTQAGSAIARVPADPVDATLDRQPTASTAPPRKDDQSNTDIDIDSGAGAIDATLDRPTHVAQPGPTQVRSAAVAADALDQTRDSGVSARSADAPTRPDPDAAPASLPFSGGSAS